MYNESVKNSAYLYKRHNCNLSDRFDFSCGCPIWVAGRLPDGSLIPRQSVNTSDMRVAEKILSSHVRERTETVSPVRGITIQSALDSYLMSKNHEVCERVKESYRVVVGRLINFCQQRQIYYLSEITIGVLDAFGEKMFTDKKPSTRSGHMGKIKALLKDAYRREWIEEPIAHKMKSYTAHHDQTKPYTDTEVDALFEGCNHMPTNGKPGYAHKPETFKLLLRLQLETGMRCGDATQYDPKSGLLFRSDDDTDSWTYRFFPQKQRVKFKRKTLNVYLTEELKTAIDSCDWMSEHYPFAYGTHSLVNEAYHRMQAIGRMQNITNCRPHRLRDTFAVRLLENGFSLDDVKTLLGHSSVSMTERYYNPWTRARGNSLRGKLSKALRDYPVRNK